MKLSVLLIKLDHPSRFNPFLPVKREPNIFLVRYLPEVVVHSAITEVSINNINMKK